MFLMMMMILKLMMIEKNSNFSLYYIMNLKRHRQKKTYYRDTYNIVCLLLLKLVFIVFFFIISFMGFFFFLYVTCLSKGLEILIGWPHHMETANESHCSDYFLLDVARLFMSSIWPSSISDCNLSPPSIGFWSDGQEAFIFVLFLLDCLEVACLLSTHVNIEWNNVGFFSFIFC